MEQVIQQKTEFEEHEFFEKVRKFLNNKQVYAEFLKCINLYTQEIISVAELVRLVSNFVGKAHELMDWFKRFVGYKDSISGTFFLYEY